MSFGGAGVGAVLSNEASVLNPGSITFYDKSSLYYQSSNTEIDPKDADRTVTGPPFPSEKKSQALIITDTSNAAKGAFSYQSQKEFDAQRRRLTFTASGLVGGNSSLGFLYRYSREKTDMSTALAEKKYHQLVVGATHILTDSFSLGIIYVDPFETIPEDTKVILGTQLNVFDMISFLIDVGANPSEELSETAVYKGALQMKFFSEVFVRFGTFTDKQLGVKGNGWGVSWSGPKLSLDFAMKSTRPIDNQSALLYEEEKIQETSFAVNLMF
ncbi:MAG: hypothetical protein JNM93_09565 [Bacteriovoracaceae bacterium]|nr:hypothetical protein [Bacteriovoracaceae bacterium]